MLRQALTLIEAGDLAGARALIGQALEDHGVHLPVAGRECLQPELVASGRLNARAGWDWVLMAYDALNPGTEQNCMHNPGFAATSLRTAANLLESGDAGNLV